MQSVVSPMIVDLYVWHGQWAIGTKILHLGRTWVSIGEHQATMITILIRWG